MLCCSLSLFALRCDHCTAIARLTPQFVPAATLQSTCAITVYNPGSTVRPLRAVESTFSAIAEHHLVGSPSRGSATLIAPSSHICAHYHALELAPDASIVHRHHGSRLFHRMAIMAKARLHSRLRHSPHDPPRRRKASTYPLETTQILRRRRERAERTSST